MKNIFKILLLFVVLTSCTCNIENNVKSKHKDTRIKKMETTFIDGYRITIIKVDEKEFLLNSDGGIIAL